MVRPLRIEFPGAFYHVTSRGNDQKDIYRDDMDRRAFLDVLKQVYERFNWGIHAYCLMGNHYHLLIETPEANLSKGMRQLNSVYTQRFNRRHQRVGHVLQGRYKAILVERDAYFLELTRYIVLNPVRAGICASPRDWPWSSYRATVGQEPAPIWLQINRLLSQFSRSRKEAGERYSTFVDEGKQKASPWEELKSQIYLGSDSFVEEMQAKHGAGPLLDEVPTTQQRPPAQPLSYFTEHYPGRDAAIAKAYYSGHYSMRALGEHFGLHYSSISRIIRRSEHATVKT